MKYKVTCDNCGKEFLVESVPGRTVRCVCPGCGGTMRFVLPRQAVPASATQPHGVRRTPSARARKGGRRWANRLLAFLFVCFSVLAVLAVVFLFTSRYTDRPIETPPSGRFVDTATVVPDFDMEEELQSEPEPEIDTLVVDSPPEEHEQERQTEPEAADSLLD